MQYFCYDHRPVRLPPERRPLPDEPGAVPARPRRALTVRTPAGTTPADHVHPEVVQVMREIGIDLADRTPQLLTPELAEQADIVVTMGCGDQCPLHPRQALHRLAVPRPRRPADRARPRDPRGNRQTYEAARSRALSHLASLRDQPTATAGCTSAARKNSQSMSGVQYVRHHSETTDWRRTWLRHPVAAVAVVEVR